MAGKKRGRRKKAPEEKVLGNGFLGYQWERLTKEAHARGYTEVMPYVRAIISEYFAMEDAQQAAEEELEPIQALRR